MKTDTPQLTHRFESALTYAAQLHSTQLRKQSTVPYISHLLGVASLVLEDGGDEDQAIAALLHDAVEDQGGSSTREAIRQRYGEQVTRLIDGCTEIQSHPQPSWKIRKLNYIDALQQAPPEVLRITLADKLHNARSILFGRHELGAAVWDRFGAPKEEVLWFYRRVADVIGASLDSPMLKELSQVLKQLEYPAEISNSK